MKVFSLKPLSICDTNSYIVATSETLEGCSQHLNTLTTDLIMHFLQRHATVSYQGERRLHVM